MSYSSLKPDAHIVIFCRQDVVEAFQEVIKQAGYQLHNVVNWVKNNHGSGDTRRTLLPKNEMIIHNTKGKPEVLVGKPDVFERYGG